MTSSRVPTKPSKNQLRLLEAIGAGATVREYSVEAGISYDTSIDRLRRLKMMTGKRSLPSLVYWGLTEMYIHYESLDSLQKPNPMHLEVVCHIAMGDPPIKIQRSLHLSKDSLERQVRNARARAGARTQSHLVAICWTKDWIS